MSRIGLQKSVRLFHKFSEETARRRGGNQAGRDGISHLAALAAVLKGEQAFTPALLEPLAAFTNLLQSAQLPPEFGNYSFGDAVLAIEEAHAERRQHDAQHWEFEGEVTDEMAPLAARFASPSPPGSSEEHRKKMARFVLDAAQPAEPSATLLVVGALAEPALPLGELCARFGRVVLSDWDTARLEERVRQAVPEALRPRVVLERYDLSGCCATFDRAVQTRVAEASDATQAEQALAELLQSFDVSAGSAGLSAVAEKPDLAVSAMVLSGLGYGFRARVAEHLRGRGWGVGATLQQELDLFEVWLTQHHIHALLRRAKAAVLVSAVSEVVLQSLPNGKKSAAGEPRDLLGVERLVERLPEIAEVHAEASWEVETESTGPEKRSLLTLVEAVLV